MHNAQPITIKLPRLGTSSWRSGKAGWLNNCASDIHMCHYRESLMSSLQTFLAVNM